MVRGKGDNKVTNDHEYVTFETTGRIVCANGGIIGIDPRLEVHDGYDGMFNTMKRGPGFDDRPMEPQERTELADYMIGLWSKFKEAK